MAQVVSKRSSVKLIRRKQAVFGRVIIGDLQDTERSRRREVTIMIWSGDILPMGKSESTFWQAEFCGQAERARTYQLTWGGVVLECPDSMF